MLTRLGFKSLKVISICPTKLSACRSVAVSLNCYSTSYSTILLKSCTSCQPHKARESNLIRSPVSLLIPSRNFAARKGTRTRKEKKKQGKKEDVKQPYLFRSVRKLLEQPYVKQRPLDDSHLPNAVDDVYFLSDFRSISYPFAQAVQNLKEVNHPQIYNLPNATVSLRVNVDLTYPNRPTKFMEGWRSVIEMKAPFSLEGMERPSVIAFCMEDSDYIADVLKSGADVAGGKELIKSIQAGDLNANDYEYIVAHPSIVPDLTAIRGLIKKKFPTVKTRTISANLVDEVKRLKAGIKIRLAKSDREPDFSYLETPIGSIDMPVEDLESNFLSVLRDTYPRRVVGKDADKFVISCTLRTVQEGKLREFFKVNLSPYLGEFLVRRKPQEIVEEEEPQVATAAASTS